MELVRQSALYHLCGAALRGVDSAASRSMLAAWLGAVWRWLCRQYDRSLLRRVVKWESTLDAKLPESVFGSLLNLLLSLPDRILHGSMVGTVFQGFASRWTVILLGFTGLVLLSVPYENWNNYYALYLLMAAFVLLMLSHERRLSLREIGFWPLLFVLLTFASASGFWSRFPGESSRFFAFALSCALAVLICVHAADTPEKLTRILLFIALGLLICCGYGLWQRIDGIEPNAHYTDLSANANMPGRVYSFFDNPNSFAIIPVLFGPVMLAMVCYSPKLWQRLVFALAFLLSALCLIMTYTRGAWVAWLVSIFVFVLAVRPRLAPWLFGLGVVCFPLLPQSVLERFLTIFSGDSSINSRAPIYMAIVRLIKRNLLFGVGLGSTTLRRVVNTSGYYTGFAYFVHSHNQFTQIWGESGIFAMVSYVFATFFPVKRGIRAGADRGNEPVTRAAAVGGAAGLISAVLFGLTDYLWSYPRIMLLYWFLFGIMTAAVKLSRKTELE